MSLFQPLWPLLTVTQTKFLSERTISPAFLPISVHFIFGRDRWKPQLRSQPVGILSPVNRPRLHRFLILFPSFVMQPGGVRGGQARPTLFYAILTVPYTFPVEIRVSPSGCYIPCSPRRSFVA